MVASSQHYFFYNHDSNRYLYFDPKCDGGEVVYNEWIFDVDEPSTTAENDLDGDNSCSYASYVVSTSTTPPTGTKTWQTYCGSDWESNELTVTGFDSVDIAVTSAQQFYDSVSTNGATTMNSGDRILFAEGHYKCSTCRSAFVMFKTPDQLFGSLTCTSDDLSCVLDGESTRGIMYIAETGVQGFKLQGLRLYQGNSAGSTAGALFINSGAKVVLQFCALDNNAVSYGGAIFVSTDSELTAYGTSFSSNQASNAGPDIYNVGKVRINSVCPRRWVSAPYNSHKNL